MLNLVIIIGVVYLIVLPIFLWALTFLHKKVMIDRRIKKMGNNRKITDKLPEPIWPKWKGRIGFALKDKRIFSIGKEKGDDSNKKMTNQQFFFIIYALGFIISIVGSFLQIWFLILIGFITFFVAVGIGMKKSRPILDAQQNVYKRMFEVGKSRLGLSAEYESNPQSLIKVLDWRDYIKPQKVEFQVPTTFGQDSEEAFMKQFNQIFGSETAWVASDEEITDKEGNVTGFKPGWNYEDGKLTINAVPPLPQMAPWSEHYVLDPRIAWSFFPIGLGVENGIELENKETGEIENVIGFDLSGLQAGIAKDHNIKIANNLTSPAPMVLIGGGTGGGKAADVNMLVKVVEKH